MTTIDHPLIDIATAVAELVDSLFGLPSNPLSIYLDLEGVNLSRNGSISIIQILVYPSNEIHLIDTHHLKTVAFTTVGETGKHFKECCNQSPSQKSFSTSEMIQTHYFLTSVSNLQVSKTFNSWSSPPAPHTRNEPFLA